MQSPRLADDPTNIMLACDESHRLIDRVDPHRYTVQVLRAMRERSVRQVERLLSTLRYPEVEPIMLVGNISGQPHHFSTRAAEEALWQAGLRQTRGQPEFFCLNGNHLHDPHAQHYWGSLFEALKADIPRLQALLNGTRRVLHWQKAITLLWQGKVELLEVYDRQIHGISISIKLPSDAALEAGQAQG